MPEPGREPGLRVQLIGPAEATHERRDTAASIAVVVVVVVRFAGELVQRVVDERVVVGIVFVAERSGIEARARESEKVLVRFLVLLLVQFFEGGLP